MTLEKLDMLHKAQDFVGGHHVDKLEEIIRSFSTYEFFKAVFLAIDTMVPSKENDCQYYFSKLNIKAGKRKVDILESIKALAASPEPLHQGQVDGGLRCIIVVLNDIKDKQQKAILFDEIWDLIAPLILHLYEASKPQAA